LIAKIQSAKVCAGKIAIKKRDYITTIVSKNDKITIFKERIA